MRNKSNRKKMMIAAIAAAGILTGCAGSVRSLEATSWKITGLTAPDGTEYDEAAYDAIIGATVYEFQPQGILSCSVNGEITGTYSYTYENGEVFIELEEKACSGKVKKESMKLSLEGEGEAILTLQK